MEFLTLIYTIIVDYVFPLIIVLGVLVFIHELGHFLAAKFFGVRVERFSIGFPPRLFGVKVGDTDYCISAVPLGGYVKMSGMIDESLDAEQMKRPPEPYEFRAKGTFPKIVIITAGVIMNFLLGVGIFWGVFWLKGETITPTTSVAITAGEIADSVGFKTNDKLLSINGVPVSNWEDVSRGILGSIGEETTFIVDRQGEQKSLFLDWGNRESKDIVRLGIRPQLSTLVGTLAADFPAKKAGLQKGDMILAINDSAITTWDEMSRIIRANPNREMPFQILRGQDTLIFSFAPKSITLTAADSSTQTVGQIGIRPGSDHRPLGFWESGRRGLAEALFFGQANIKGFSRVVSGVDDARDSIAGPLAIAKMVGDLAQESFIDLLRMMAMLSVVLAFVNILPIPALDGGHLVIIIIEGILKRPLPLNIKLVVQQVGMLILLLLMVFIFYNDIARWVSQ